jgi:apolipoprotein D and lipocalin family protein
MRYCITVCCLLLLAGCKSTSHLKVVGDFDADRYTGVWFEAARLPHRFENGMSSVSATYSWNADGTIKVVNRGFKDNDKAWEQIEGVAKFKDQKDKGWLKVSFFKPFYASYKIIYLDEDYTKAIVTGPTYGYLWILARDPNLSNEHLDELVSMAGDLGFDTAKLIIVDQSRNVK